MAEACAIRIDLSFTCAIWVRCPGGMKHRFSETLPGVLVQSSGRRSLDVSEPGLVLRCFT